MASGRPTSEDMMPKTQPAKRWRQLQYVAEGHTLWQYEAADRRYRPETPEDPDDLVGWRPLATVCREPKCPPDLPWDAHLFDGSQAAWSFETLEIAQSATLRMLAARGG